MRSGFPNIAPNKGLKKTPLRPAQRSILFPKKGEPRMKKMLIVLLVLSACVATAAQAQLLAWQQWFTSGTPPSPRQGHAAVAARSVDSIFVFGGRDRTGLLNDLYALPAQGNHIWTQLNPRGTLPSRRAGHSAVLIPSRDRILVFGGYAPGGSCLNDVWALDSLATGGHWFLLAPGGTPPSPRAEHSAVYDSVFDRMIVYAGRDSASNPLADVWALDSVSMGDGHWRQLSPAGTPPSARFDHSGAYERTNRRLVVFGGRGASGALGDLYTLDLTTSDGLWSAWNPGGQAPTPRYGHIAIYANSWSGTMFLFGGQSDSTTFFSDTYYLNTQWYRPNLYSYPAARSQMPVVPSLTTGWWGILDIIGGTIGDSLAKDTWDLLSGDAVEEPGRVDAAAPKMGFSVSPNPTWGPCQILLSGASIEKADFLIYNVTGRLVRTLKNPLRESGGVLSWDGRNDEGRPVAGGVYFIRRAGASGPAGAKVLILR